ncbi:MAG: hypothetical protein COU35_04455 [Candidatus Magasanikbacteria bacterium CG10_big_fil_rev_8_21_14_0_10_47_10]|uniref:Uncharacterized protein n=1 Tax=Candidatus Magasanikbacteria bacterium CG10_big_fil_rev_8_21_14_0_10_47_10 TaxID=1974652 RepID=A0A2H0TRA8_9BACT|nr:MAG: hypothetical protein COU35_04455 [Candidatus Magasanikbacteria bacterium CG10_big_fil_rev_8_21_14_0_10_47_10]
MNWVKKQQIAFFVLVALLYSCAGAGLGMTMTTVFPHPAHTSMAAASNSEHSACCKGGAESTDMDANDKIAHHTDIVFTLAEKAAGPFAAFFTFILIFLAVPTRMQGDMAARAYVRDWWARWRYFCDIFTRLFSSGILHAKTW